MKDNIIENKLKAFAVRIVRLYQYVSKNKQEYVLSKQLLRSGTSIGANVAEALCAVSKKDFLSKMHIAFKECIESQYWLELMVKTDYLDEKEYQSIYNDCTELRILLSSITKSTAANLIPHS